MTASKWTRSAGILVAMMALAAATGGCQEQQLKQEIATLNARLRLANAENDGLRNDVAELRDDRTRIEGDLAQAQRDLAAKPKETIVYADKKPDLGPGVEWDETAREITVTLPNAILFGSGQAVLKAGSKTTLGKVASIISSEYSGNMIRVEGHTDSDPIRKSKWKDNWELSCQRALAVVRHLVTRGIDKSKVCAGGFGSYSPRASNATAAGKAKNRRVQVVIIK